jgi:hypothetical protein
LTREIIYSGIGNSSENQGNRLEGSGYKFAEKMPYLRNVDNDIGAAGSGRNHPRHIQYIPVLRVLHLERLIREYNLRVRPF